MAKPRKQKETSSLLKALNFVAKAQKEVGTPLQTHCYIQNNFVTATDGILTAGHAIEEDLVCCPHTYRLLNAISHCGQQLSITQLENTRLSIKSGKFNAFVPCLPEPVTIITPDVYCGAISDVIREGFSRIQHLAIDGAERAVLASVLLTANTMASTSGFVILEFWHGIDLPALVLPKPFVQAICNTDKKIVGFGFSQSSCTFWFEDQSWIKTQLYADPWPDISQVLNVETKPEPLAKGFYDALRVVEDFAEEGKEKGSVYFSEAGMRTGKDDTDGASYAFKGLPVGMGFKIKQLKQVENAMEQVWFDIKGGKAYFFGVMVRGCIMAVR